MGTGAVPGSKAARACRWPPTPPTFEVKNERSYTSTSPHVSATYTETQTSVAYFYNGCLRTSWVATPAHNRWTLQRWIEADGHQRVYYVHSLRAKIWTRLMEEVLNMVWKYDDDDGGDGGDDERTHRETHTLQGWWVQRLMVGEGEGEDESVTSVNTCVTCSAHFLLHSHLAGSSWYCACRRRGATEVVRSAGRRGGGLRSDIAGAKVWEATIRTERRAEKRRKRETGTNRGISEERKERRK
jgi:hypothetical protein